VDEAEDIAETLKGLHNLAKTFMDETGIIFLERLANDDDKKA
jgi:hypothetical protein